MQETSADPTLKSQEPAQGHGAGSAVLPPDAPAEREESSHARSGTADQCPGDSTEAAPTQVASKRTSIAALVAAALRRQPAQAESLDKPAHDQAASAGGSSSCGASARSPPAEEPQSTLSVEGGERIELPALSAPGQPAAGCGIPDRLVEDQKGRADAAKTASGDSKQDGADGADLIHPVSKETPAATPCPRLAAGRDSSKHNTHADAAKSPEG